MERYNGKGARLFPLPYHISPSPTRPAVSAHLAPHSPAAPSRRVAGNPLYIPTRTPAPRRGVSPPDSDAKPAMEPHRARHETDRRARSPVPGNPDPAPPANATQHTP